MKTLVTGADGFVGSRLVARLLERGDDVVATVAPGMRTLDGVEPLPLDICSSSQVNATLRSVRPDVVVHLAGLSDVAASWDDVASYYRVNVVGACNVLEGAPSGCRVVVASSADVYGRIEDKEGRVDENCELRPGSPYALTKAALEHLALPAGAIVARCFSLIGPGQATRFALASFADQLARIARGEQAPVLRVGDLSTRRDFLHVDDGVDAYVTLAHRGTAGTVYNIARGEAVPIAGALERLIELTGLEVEVETDPERFRPADIPVLIGVANRLRALGWEPRRTIDDALRDLWESQSVPTGVVAQPPAPPAG